MDVPAFDETASLFEAMDVVRSGMHCRGGFWNETNYRYRKSSIE